MPFMRTLTLFLACLLLPAAAAASLFTPPPTDKSVELLGMIFGTNVGPVYLGGAANPALMHMFELFNAVILTIGTIIVSYIGLVSTINTAQEGKAMGKKWNSIWIPMRATLGMLLMIPTPSTGYSVIQTGVMWLIIQGIGAADQIWNGVLADLGSGLSVNRAVQMEAQMPNLYAILDAQAQDLTVDVLNSTVCMQVLNSIPHIINKFGRADWHDGASNLNILTDNEAQITGTVYAGMRGHRDLFDICGRYDINAAVERLEWGDIVINQKELRLKAIEIYNQKRLAIHFMSEALKPVVIAIENETATPRHDGRLAEDTPEDLPVMPAGGINSAYHAYTNSLGSLVKPQFNPTLREIVYQGRLTGWISASSFYFALNHNSPLDFFNSVGVPPVSHNVPSCNLVAECRDHLPAHAPVLNGKINVFIEQHADKTHLATRLWDASVYLRKDKADILKEMTAHGDLHGGEAHVNNRQQEILRLLMPFMTGHDLDPLIAQGKFGGQLMLYSERSWRRDINEARGLINEAAQQENLPDEVKAMIDELHTLGVIDLSFFGILWVIGATLSIYIPLIPYMIFTVAVVGWFLLVIEAIVAAPILALSFILPSGEELGKIMQGLMLLLNILLRPTLMLFGFVLASRLYRAIIELVNFSILGNFAMLESSKSDFAWVALLALYGAFVVALSNKCFSLIYAIPDKILRWMGGGPEHTDVSQELGQAKGALSKGADTVNKINTGFGERELARLKDRANQQNPADEVQGGGNNNRGGDGDGG